MSIIRNMIAAKSGFGRREKYAVQIRRIGIDVDMRMPRTRDGQAREECGTDMEEKVKMRKKKWAVVLLAAAAALLLRVGSQEEQEVVVACVTGVAENEVSDPASEQEQGIRQDNADNPIDHEEQMRVALTFDDGPHPVYTPRLLDGLKARGVHASFFMVGENAAANPELVERIYEEGHLIGNHTYSHQQLTTLSEEAATQELTKTQEVLEQITGEWPLYVRPPFGSWNRELEGEVSMLPVLWSVDSLDWTTTNTAEIVRRVVTQVKEDDIILMHDYYASSVEAALQVVDQLQTAGFTFVTADELSVE